MALSTTTNRVTYAGNGSTTPFSFPYYFLADADLVVILKVDATGVETVQTITTHYTVTGSGVAAGGTVTMITAPATGETLTIYRDPALTQGLDLVENDSAPAEPMEEAWDRAMMVAQRLDDRVDRSIILSDGFTDSFTLQLPSDLATADYFLKVNTAADGFEMAAAADVATISVPAGTGILAKTSATATVVRDIDGTSGVISVANGDGVAGNPTISLDNDGVTTAKILDANVTKAKLATGAIGNSTITAKTATYTVAATDDFLTGDTTSAAFSFTLPTAVGISGREYTIKRIDASVNDLTLDGNGSETIDGALTQILPKQYDMLTVVSDGANWLIKIDRRQSVFVRYNTNTAQSISGAGSDNILNYEDSVNDDDSLVTIGASWLWTSDAARVVDVNARVTWADSTSWDDGEKCQMNLHVGGSFHSSLDYNEVMSKVGGSGVTMDLSGSTSLVVAKGDTLRIVLTATSGASVALNGVAGDNWITIKGY